MTARFPVVRWLILVLLFSSTVPGYSQSADPLAGLDAYVEQAMRDWSVPGLAVAVVKDDRVIYAKGFGVRQIGRPDRVDENTIFAVASNSKALTATALGMLVSERMLDWDDPATRYLPYLQLHDPWATRELSIRDLLTHRTGYATWQGDLLWYGSDRSTEEVLKGIRHLEPVSSFRSRYGYNNLMYIAAGEVIPAVTGKSWAEFVQERLLTPLGMTRTSTTVRALSGMDNVAQPHTRMETRTVAIPYRALDNAAAAGAVNSSVRDWAQWLRLQLRSGAYEGLQVVDSATIRETRTPQIVWPVGGTTRRLFPTTHFVGYGLGWFLRDYHGRLLVSHGGGMDGMLSETAIVPEEGVGVAVFTNYDDHSLQSALAYEIVDRLLGVSSPDRSGILLERHRQRSVAASPAPPVQGTRPALPLSDYAGTYLNEVLGEARVTYADGKLRLQLVHNPGVAGELTHWQHDTFQAAWGDRFLGTSLVTFSVNARARADAFRMQVRPDFVDPQEYVFRRRE